MSEHNSNDSKSNNASIHDGDLLEIANNILNLLNYSQKLENEEDLFLDDFYVSTLGNFLSEGQLEISPGNSPEEKVEILNQLIQMLSQMIEMDLSNISGEAIVIKHDKTSVKFLLELIEELLKTIINVNNEEENENSKDFLATKEETNENNDNDQSNNEREKSEEIDDVNNDINILENNSNENNNNNYSKEKEGSPESLSLHQKKHKTNTIEDLSNHSSNKNNSKNNISNNSKNIVEKNLSSNNNSPYINLSCFEHLDLEKAVKRNKKDKDQEVDSYIRQTFSQNDVSEYERKLQKERNQTTDENNEENNENEENNNLNKEDSHIMNVSHITDLNKSNNNNNQKSNNQSSNDIPGLIPNEKNKKNQKNKNNLYEEDNENNEESEEDIEQESRSAYSVPQAYKKPHIPTSSEEVEKSNKNNDELEKLGDMIIKNSNSNTKNVIKEGSIEDESKVHEIDNQKNYINESSEQKIKQTSNNNTSKKLKNSTTNKKNTSNKSSKKSSEIKNKINDNEIIQKENDIQQKEKIENDESINNIYPEIPTDDEQLKIEIIRELRRRYGNKLDNLFLKYNCQNSDNFEMVLRNIKLAKQNMNIIQKRIPNFDDTLTKQYLLRYENELNNMITQYNKERYRRNYMKERAIKNLDQNMKDIKKIKEIELQNTDKELERRRKAKEVREYHNKMRLCNEIYKQALQLEKEKNLEEVKFQKEISKMENNEKRIMMMAIEKYYKDKIKMLREILEVEKRERELQHREHLKYLSELEREKKQQYKKELNTIFERFDEEERKEEYDINNRETIKKIFESYYGH